MEYLALNNGQMIPAVGMGTNTFGKENGMYMAEVNGDFAEAKSAIAAGYRLFDTAISYRNERGIGQILAESSVPREDFFIVTKIPGNDEYAKTVRQAVENSLVNLKSNYIDLYLIHHPWENKQGMIRMWNGLTELREEGKIRAIGVSNFMVKDLELIQKESDVKPVVNQVQCNPGEWNDEVITYCKQNGILPMAWGPLQKVNAAYRAKLEKVAEKHHKLWAQILLRYDFQRGICVIPKSRNIVHQNENIDIFDFSLGQEDMEYLSNTSNA